MERLTIKLRGYQSPVTPDNSSTKESVRGAERPPLKARPECGSRIPGKELRYLSGSVYELFERGHRRCMQGAEGEGEAEGFEMTEKYI